MSISSEKGSSIPFWSLQSSGPEDNKRRWRPSRLPGVLNGYETQKEINMKWTGYTKKMWEGGYFYYFYGGEM